MASKFEILLQATLDKSNSRAQIEKDIAQIEKGLNINLNLKADTKSASEMKSAINGIGKSAQEANGHLQNLGDIANKFSRWQIVGDIIHGIKNGIQDMVQQVFDLDSSLTEFRKVTDLTGNQMDSFIDKSYETAESVARTR